jgi:hypothetical protein
MPLDRWEDLLRRGCLREALSEALAQAARLDGEVESCTRAGEHGEATRAERARDEWRMRTLELQARIEIAERGGARCPDCRERGTSRPGPEATMLQCPRCGRVWDGEAELRFVDVVRAPVTLSGFPGFILGPPTRETGHEAQLTWFLEQRGPHAPTLAWSPSGLEIVIPSGSPTVLLNGAPAAGRLTLRPGDHLALGGTELRLRPS